MIFSLQDLPSEILLAIADSVTDPWTVFNFAVTCRRLHQVLSLPLVKHKRPAQQHSLRRFELSCSEQYVVDLQQLLSDVDIQRYTRTFEYQDLSYEFDEPQVPDEIVASYLDKLRQTPLLNVAVALSWRIHEERYVKDDAAVGNVDAMLAIILSCLPHVRTLRLSMIRMYDCVQTLFRRLGEMYNHGSSLSLLPLQYLKEVYLSVPDKNCSTLDPEWAFYLLRLPSLRKFEAYYVGDEWRGSWSQINDWVALQHNKSLTESIIFEESKLHPHTTIRLLQDIHALKLFQYGCDCDGPYPMKFTPPNVLPQLVPTLLEYHSASLEVLIFEDDESWQENYDDYHEDHRPLNCTSMQDFLALKVLHCCIAQLRPVSKDGLHSKTDCILDRLPSSLQQLYVYDTTREDNSESVLQFLQDLEQRPDTALPSLKILWLGPGFANPILGEAQRACQKRGLEFKPPDFGRYREVI